MTRVARHARRVTGQPWRVLGGTLCAGLVALVVLVDLPGGRLRLALDPAMAALIPQHGAAAAAFARTRTLLGDDDLLLVIWRGDDLFTPASLAAHAGLVAAIAALPEVARVDSLATAPDLQIDDDVSAVAPFLAGLPATATDAAALRERALASPLVRGMLVSSDGRGLLLAVHFQPDLPRERLAGLVASVEKLSAQHAVGRAHFLSGPLHLRLAVATALEHDLLRLTPLAMLATFIVAALAFRSLRGACIPLVANGLTTLIALAAYTLTGGRFDFVTATLAPVVFVVGFAYAVHVVCAFERRYAGSARAAASAHALLEVWSALGLTALTTVIGFAALALSPVPSIRTFGLSAACGIAFAWVGAVTLVPAMLVLVPGAPRARSPGATRLASYLATFACRHGRTALAAASVLGVLACAAATRIQVDTALLDNFAAEHPARQNFAALATHFAGPVPMQIVIESEHGDALREPAALAALADLDAWLEAQPEIGGAYGLVDYVGLLYRALAPELAAAEPLPAARPYRHALLLANPAILGRFATPDFRTTVIHLRTSALSTAAVNTLAARIEARLAALPGTLRGSVTGTTVLSARGVDAISRGQVRSLGVALLLVAMVLATVFRSVLVGVVVLLPSALPILCFFGLLGLLPITLNLSTSLVACAVFGIAIDDSVHLLARYAAACRHHSGREAAIAAALDSVLRPVTITTAALVIGFGALACAELRGQVEFGLLAAVTLFMAWLTDLAVTPALLLHLRRRLSRAAQR